MEIPQTNVNIFSVSNAVFIMICCSLVRQDQCKTLYDLHPYKIEIIANGNYLKKDRKREYVFRLRKYNYYVYVVRLFYACCLTF